MTRVNGVNGDGPRCGCGQRSRMHVVGRGKDIFLCDECALSAACAYIVRVDQPDQEQPGEYYVGLLRGEHRRGEHRRERDRARWCPDCDAEQEAMTP